MFAELVFETFDILEKNCTVAANRHGAHVEREEQLGTRTLLDVDLVGLPRERCIEVVFIGKHRAGIYNRGVVEPCQRHFRTAVGGHSPRSAAFGVDNIYVVAAHTVAEKSYFRAVGAPYRIRVITAVGGKTSGASAGRRDTVDVAFISKGDCTAVGRNRGVSQPQRCFGGNSSGCGKRCAQCDNEFLHIVDWITYMLLFK